MNLKTLKVKEKRYTVKLGESLFLRVHPSGVKSYVLRYSAAGRVKDITLGHYPDVTLLQARQLAHLKRKELEIKPSKGLTFTDAYRLWKRKKKGKIVSYADEVQRIDKYLMSPLKNTLLTEITAPVALNILLKLDKKLPTLKRVLMRLNEILDLAVCAGLLDNNPCRRLSKVFSTHTPKHRPFIKAEELGQLFNAIKNEPTYFQIYVIFCVYSALRPVESVAVKWSWIIDNTLTLPAEVMKKRRQHRVPLTIEIIALLKLVKTLRKARSPYVFPFGQSNRPIHKQHLERWLYKHGFKDKLTHHGLRATLRTWLADEQVPFEVAEDAIAHVTLSATERAYLRGDFLEQRRIVMQKYCDFILERYCANCADSDVAIPIINTISKTITKKQVLC